jgi:hypothetical protein
VSTKLLSMSLNIVSPYVIYLIVDATISIKKIVICISHDFKFTFILALL